MSTEPILGNTSDLYDDLYDQLKKAIVNKKITTSSIVIIASQAMEIVQQYPDLTGAQKKDIVLGLLHRLVDDSKIDDDEKKAVKDAIDTTVSVSIDLIKLAYHRKLHLGKVKKVYQVIKKLFNCKGKK